jgi:hypothetical protein
MHNVKVSRVTCREIFFFKGSSKGKNKIARVTKIAFGG